MIKLLVLFVLFFVGCGDFLTEGTVVEKTHEPARTYTIMQPTTIHNGEDTKFITIPVTHFDDEDFILTIQKFDEESGEYLESDVYVDEKVYLVVNIGDYFIYDPDFHQINDPTVSKMDSSAL